MKARARCSGVKCFGVKCSGVKCSGVKCSGVKCSGVRCQVPGSRFDVPGDPQQGGCPIALGAWAIRHMGIRQPGNWVIR